MTREELITIIKQKKSFLCIGLDTDPARIPAFLHKEKDPVFSFNKAIIDATRDLAIAYKPNTAFYEAQGIPGWQSLEKTTDYLHQFKKDLFTIADAKRGDIGNTSKQYARAFFEFFDFDAITVAPYMGEDSVSPFLSFHGKWAIILALTSNPGSDNFQMKSIVDEGFLYEQVIKTARAWGDESNIMFVVGATKAEMLEKIRKLVPDHFLLVPGVGAQGGSLEEVAKYGMNDNCGLIINASRSIIYASSGNDFAEKARREAMDLQQQMQVLLNLTN